MNALEELTEKARVELKEKMRYAHDHNVPLHYRRCANCELKGTLHEAEFLGLRDEDGSQFLNIVDEDPIVAMLWVNFNGCKTFRKASTKGGAR
jgi:hypothetical protein